MFLEYATGLKLPNNVLKDVTLPYPTTYTFFIKFPLYLSVLLVVPVNGHEPDAYLLFAVV